MLSNTVFRPDSGRASARLNLRLGAAIGPLTLAMIALPGVARAQDECGAAPAGGTVTCSPADNPFPNGITYVAQPADLTVVLEDGVDVQTTAAANAGIRLDGVAALTLDGGAATVSTTGAGANGVDVTSVAGPIDIVIGDVGTTGAASAGVRAIGGGDVTVSTGNVSTTNAAGSNYAFFPTATGIVATSLGAGDVSVTAGDVDTAGLGAAGINAGAATGDVDVAVGDVATTGGRANGVTAQSFAGDVSVASGSISTLGDGSAGISASSGTGSVTVDAGAITTAGFAARGIDASGGAGGVDVGFTTIGTGGTFASGVSAISTGGDVTVSGTGITTSGPASFALYAASDVGDVAVTTTGTVASTGRGGTGILATSGTGSVIVTANNVTTVAADAADAETSRGAIFAEGASATVVTTGAVTTAGRALYGGTGDAITVTGTAGDARATVNGVRASGDTARALVVTASGDAFATVNGGIAASGLGADAVVVSGGDNATVTVASGGIVTAQNGNAITIASVNGSTLTNAGTIPNAGNGYAVLALGGPITINNSGTLSSDILLTAGNDRIDNSGEFLVRTNPDFGAGTDVFTNTGTVLFGSGNAVTRTFTGLETFNNAGLIELRNGVAGDRLVLPGSFAGSGNSRLGLDISASANDQLVLGGAASGSTVVLLDRAPGMATTFDPGTVLVQAGAASGAAAFDLEGGFQNAGLVRYEIVYNPADFSYSLTGAPSDAAFRTLNYVEGARNLWLKSADVVSGQLRARRDALWAFGGGDPAGKLWVQIHGSVESRDGSRAVDTLGQVRTVDTGFRQDYYGGQIGFDFGGGVGDRGGFAIGVTGGYINSSQNFAGSADRIDYDVVNAGVYASYSSGNLFLNALGKYDYYWAKATSALGEFREDFKGASYGGRGEVGMRFGGDSFFIEPAASISYVKADFDNFASRGITVRFNEDDGLRGRAGARLGGQFALGEGPVMAFYVGGNYVHEFKGEDRVTFAGGGQSFGYTNRRLDDYGEGVVGFTIGQTNGVSGFIEGSYIRSFNTGGTRTDIEGAGGRAGLRIAF